MSIESATRSFPKSAGAAIFLLILAHPYSPLLASVFALSEKEPVSIRADQVEYFDQMGKVVASGNVEATYRDVKLTCDQAMIYMETKDAYLKGRVRLFQLDGLLKGEEMIYNFQTRKGTVLGAEGEAGPWRSVGDRAEKISTDSFLHRDGYLTSCDFEEPHTRMRAREIQVYLDDKVVLKNVVMYVGPVPLLYLPSYTHPLDDKRPRVTILPGEDKQWGLFVLTAWRVYLHENLQGRFHVDYREKLDLATGLDLKYRLPAGGEGIFREYYTHQRSIQRKHLWTSLIQPDKVQPTRELERWRVQLRHVWDVDDSTKATLEYNRASDATVVKDFFEREFGENTSSPLAYLQVVRTAPWYGLTFLVNERVNRFETVTQQLPTMTLNLRPMQVPWLPGLEGSLNRLEGRLAEPAVRGNSGWFYQSSYRYEHSNVADVREGTEASLLTFDTLQELFYPMRLLRRFNFRPFFKFRESSFSRGLTEMDPQFRQAAGTGFDLSSKLFRVFPLETNLLGLNIRQLRHVMTPSLKYEYQAEPTISANRLLRSDGLAKSNKMTLGLEHKLQTKRGSENRLATVDLGRFSTSIPYDLEGTGGKGGEWGSVDMDMETLPYSWLRTESDARIDPHIGKFTTINADFIVQPGLGKGMGGRSIREMADSETGEIRDLPWAAGLGWRYQRKTSAQLTLEAEFNLTDKWRAGIFQTLDVKRFSEEVGVLQTRTVKKIYNFPEYEYRLRRDLHEWTVELVYSVQRSQGETILVLFRLKAAPELPFDFERGYNRPKAGRNFPKR